HWTIVALMNLKQITGRINQQLWLLILSTNCSIGHRYSSAKSISLGKTFSRKLE
ncbi:MAG: hypothetical protein ACI85U_001912, partial [Candidatus Promineifilaceae bacterium]